MSGINIIILLMVLSGLVAYLGDRIGMKAGKKRLSIFGLRPRYSSIIITIITGIVIAALSISILLVTYSSLRQALLNINTVINKLETLNEKLDSKDKELAVMKTEISNKSQLLDKKSKQIREYSNELSTLKNKKSELETKLKATKTEFKQEKNRLEQDVKSLRESKEELEKSKQELKQNKKELENMITKLNSQKNELQNKISSLEKRVSEVNQKYQQAKQGLQDVYEYYKGADFVYQRGEVIYSDVIVAGTSENKIIQALTDFLDKANKVAKKRAIKVNDEGRALKVRQEDILNTAKILYNLEEGQRVIVTLVARVNVSQNEWLAANFVYNINKIVFHKQELIASRKINAELSPVKIEKELRSLLENVNQKAIKNGLLTDIQNRVVDINYSQFYEVQDQIENKKGIIELKVYAVKDIWREDNLNSTNLKFTISSTGEKADE